MMSYVSEAKRLGITPRPAQMPRADAPVSGEGLHITGCDWCRQFRNDVRAALEAERRAEEVKYDAAFAEGYERGKSAGIREVMTNLRDDLTDLLEGELCDCPDCAGIDAVDLFTRG